MVNWTQRRKLKRDICVSAVVLALSVASHGIVLSLPIFIRTVETPLQAVESFPEEDMEVVTLPKQVPPEKELLEEEVFRLPEAEVFVPEVLPPPSDAVEVEDEVLPLEPEPESLPELEAEPEAEPEPISDEGDETPTQSSSKITTLVKGYTPPPNSVSCGDNCFTLEGTELNHSRDQALSGLDYDRYEDEPDDSEQPAGRRVHKLTDKQDGSIIYLISVSNFEKDLTTIFFAKTPDAPVPP